jgi:anaphase-promoting complex subunit 4
LFLKEENITEAGRCAAGFWSKGIEVQQVLDDSMKSFKAFFRWLSVEIRRISDLCLVRKKDHPGDNLNQTF